MNKNYQSSVEVKKTIKRYVVTVLCCIPLLVLIGFLLDGKVNRFVRVIIFVAILCLAVFVEEYFYNKSKIKKNSQSIHHEDVFK